MKKLLIPLIILLTCAFIITGCGTSPSSPSSPAPTTPATATPTATAPGTTAPSPSIPINTATTATSPTATAASKYGGTLKFISSVAPGTPIGIPWETSGSSVQSMQLSLQCLLKEQVDGTLTPNLAASYDVVTDPDNPSVTFNLQKGVKFSDGSDFNAQAVEWNFKKMLESNMYPSVTRYWKSIDVLDDYTIRVNMNTWLNKSVASFAKSVTYLISPTAFEKNGIDWMRWNMVGTGPFVQSDFQRDVSLTTVKNSNYWEQGKPYLDGLEYLYVVDEMTRLALFKSGGGDILDMVGNGRLTQELQSAGYNISTYRSGVAVLVPDSGNADSPWSNLKVREAADYAIDKQSIVNTFGYGYWEVNDQMNSSSSVAYDKNLPGRKYDVAKAKQLLAEAGYPNGFKTTIIAADYADHDIVAALQAYLGKVGIQCQIQLVASASYNGYTFTGSPWNNAIIFNTYTQNPNPTQGFNGSFGLGLAFKSTGRPDSWMDTLTAAMVTPKLEPALIQKVEDLAYDYELTIPLFSQTTMWAISPKVMDANLGTRGDPHFWAIQDAWFSK